MSLVVMNLRGSQREMGRQFGEIMRGVGGWEDTWEFYKTLPERLILGDLPMGPFSGVIRKTAGTLKHVALTTIHNARPAAYSQRTQGVMEGLGLKKDMAKYLSVMDVFQNVVGLAGRWKIPPFHRVSTYIPACSTLVAWDDATIDGKLRHARNFDFPGIGVWDRSPVIAFCEPKDGLRYGYVTTLGADTPGITAFNEAGVVCTLHTRFHRDVRFNGVTSIDLGHEIVHRAESIDDAIRIANSRPIASTWGVAISSGRERRAVVLETTGKAVAVTESPGDFAVCTNRYQSRALATGEISATPSWRQHSMSRERRLSELVAQARERGGLTAIDMQTALDDHCDPDTGGEYRAAGGVLGQAVTVQSVVVEPESACIYVSTGTAPTGRGPYEKVDWNWQRDVSWRRDDGSLSDSDWAFGSRNEAEILASHNGTPTIEQRRRNAYRHFVEANRIEAQSHDCHAVLTEIEAAIAITPDEPSYRFLAGVLCLKCEQTERAWEHFCRGLEREFGEFRRANMLLWAAHAADATMRVDDARELREELLATTTAVAAELRKRAIYDQDNPLCAADRRRLSVNLVLADAM